MADEPGSSAGEIDLAASAPADRAAKRRALWAALAVVAVAAGTVATSGGGGDEGLPLLPSGFGAGRAEGAAGSMADSSLMAWVTYVAGDGLPAQGGEAAAYRLAGSVDEGRVRALAEALGVDGAIEDTGESWLVTDGRATLEAVDDGGAAWWYSTTAMDVGVSSGGGTAGCEPGPAADCTLAETGQAVPTTTIVCGATKADPATPECATASCPGSADCIEPALPDEQCPPNALCTEPAPMPTLPDPAAGLPSEEEARSIALDLLAATGADVDAARVTVDGSYDAWYVSVEHTLDGVPVSGWSATVAVGPGGEVLHANGMLAQPERLGDYPLVDARAAIDRLNEQQSAVFEGGWSPYPGAAGDTATADAAVGAPVTAPCDPQLPPEELDRCLAAGGYAIPTTSVPNPCPDDTAAIEEDPASRCVDPQCMPGSVPVTTTVPGEAPVTTLAPIPTCDPVPPVEPEPIPEPEPLEVVLTTAEPVLVLTVDPEGAYLVPGYRFGNEDGHQVDVAAVADDHLAPTTTVPATDETEAPQPPPPTDCEVLVEDDGSGTTHTIQPCPPSSDASAEPRPLEPGEQPSVGVPYYVEVQTGALSHCGFVSVELGGRWWWDDDVGGGDQEPGWAVPTEGGTLTLLSEGQASFVGDAQATKVATLVPYGGSGERPLCA